jgi:hypothetical protein
MSILGLILAIAMVVPSPIDEIVGNYGRVAMVIVGLILTVWWIIQNDQKNNPVR